MRRTYDLVRQSGRDYEAAAALRKAGFHEWCCFLAHQSAEKSIKAILENAGLVERGHSVSRFLDVYSREVSAVNGERMRGARVLDTYFIASRHVMAFDMGVPADYFDQERSEEALDLAKHFLDWASEEIGGQV